MESRHLTCLGDIGEDGILQSRGGQDEELGRKDCGKLKLVKEFKNWGDKVTAPGQ